MTIFQKSWGIASSVIKNLVISFSIVPPWKNSRSYCLLKILKFTGMQKFKSCFQLLTLDSLSIRGKSYSCKSRSLKVRYFFSCLKSFGNGAPLSFPHVIKEKNEKSCLHWGVAGVQHQPTPDPLNGIIMTLSPLMTSSESVKTWNPYDRVGRISLFSSGKGERLLKTWESISGSWKKTI